ncbi:MAG: hypothetical protein Tsb0021_09890 [Chlamydiales bacterium]
MSLNISNNQTANTQGLNINAQTPLRAPEIAGEITKIFHEVDRQPVYYESYVDDPVAMRSWKQLFGSVTGVLMGAGALTTGVETFIHEYVGHVLLGLKPTYTFPKGYEPSWQVDGIDNFKNFLNAGSFSEKLLHFGRFLTGYDVNGDGAAGKTIYNNLGVPTRLGEWMGPEGRSAWVSVAGSVPGLVINSATVAGGIKMSETHPFLGNALLYSGLVQHLTTSSYSISAALMSPEQLISNGLKGHDFAKFALQMSRMTGIEAQTIAMSTALLWTAFVPAVALTIYYYQKLRETEIVPDEMGLQEWLQHVAEDEETSNKLQSYIDNYPYKEDLLNAWQEGLNQGEISQSLKIKTKKFLEYLIDKLPKKEMNAAKRDVLRKLQCLQERDRFQECLTGCTVLGNVALVAGKVFQAIGNTAKISSACSYASPLFTGISILSSGYETLKDLKTPSQKFPKAAKVISVAKLVNDVVAGLGICAAFFLPGLNILLISSILGRIIGSVGFSYMRQRIIKEHFESLQSQGRETGNV